MLLQVSVDLEMEIRGTISVQVKNKNGKKNPLFSKFLLAYLLLNSGSLYGLMNVRVSCISACAQPPGSTYL